MGKTSERGAVAVELALLLPVLLLILIGTVEFGRAYNAQITLTQAAREGARIMAITDDQSEARAATINAAVTLDPALTMDAVTIGSRDATVTPPGPVTLNTCLP